MKMKILAAVSVTAILGACANSQPGDACTMGTNAYKHAHCENDWETVVVGTATVKEVTARGVAYGNTPAKDNLTSMGRAESDGADILRVRSSRDQTVSIRKAGGGTFDVDVEAGDTLVEVESGGTYIAEFHETGAKKTKATGGHTFDDVTEVEVEVTERRRED